MRRTDEEPISLSFIERELIGAKPLFDMTGLPPSMLFKNTWMKITTAVVSSSIKGRGAQSGPRSIPGEIGKNLAGIVMSTLSTKFFTGRALNWAKKSHHKNSWTSASFDKDARSWFHEFFDMKNGRMVKKMVVVFHHADHANKHMDIHIGRVSLVLKVSGKPVEKEIKFKESGELTEPSKQALIDFLKSEIQGGAKIPQNLDHTESMAKQSWFDRNEGPNGYGAGPTRQVVLESSVEILKIGKECGKPIRMYAPSLEKNDQLYMYRLESRDNSAPIIKWGVSKSKDENFKEGPQLKKVDGDNVGRFEREVDVNTVTRKYDGAKSHFNTTESGTFFWSPRRSIVTGNRIEYTQKVPELFRLQHPSLPTGVGELLFRWKFDPKNPKHYLDFDRYLSSAEIAGILNSDRIRPLNVIPDFRIYRVDTWNKKDVSDVPFFVNRSLADHISSLNDYINLPEFTTVLIRPDWEGLVGVPPGKSINDGYKIKWWGDNSDWKVVSNNLCVGPSGHMAGTLSFISLDSGKEFKLGPGQLGKDGFTKELMEKGGNIEGMVAKVNSRFGHEGRSARFIEWHNDKGIA